MSMRSGLILNLITFEAIPKRKGGRGADASSRVCTLLVMAHEQAAECYVKSTSI